MSNEPSLSAETDRVVSVPLSTTVITVPGTTAPVWSTTVPRIVPFVCAQAVPLQENATNTNRHTRAHIFEAIAAPLGKAGATPPPRRLTPFFGCSFRKNLTIIREP